MFTPPPSPLPQSRFPSDLTYDAVRDDGRSLFLQTNMSEEGINPIFGDTLKPSEISPIRSKAEEKILVARRTRWSILLVPAVLVLVGLSTRYASHPAAFDALTRPSSHWAADLINWHHHGAHKRSPQLDNLSDPLAGPTGVAVQSFTQPSQTPSPTSSTPSTTTSLAQTQQTVPPVPINPTLPISFPQPFDTTLGNFSTQGCQAFFTNMTQTDPFRTCRPLSLLLRSSETFITAETNLTELNILIWGTCNTVTSEEQCITNMGWFAQELQTVCAIDLKNQVELVVDALTGLQSYSVMRTAGCLEDQQTGAYCYIEAAHNSNQVDAYIYDLPLGTPLPSTLTMTCDSCTSSVLKVFEQQVNSSEALKSTYNSAAEPAQKQCGGAAYAQVLSGATASSSASDARSNNEKRSEILFVFMSVVLSFWVVSSVL